MKRHVRSLWIIAIFVGLSVSCATVPQVVRLDVPPAPDLPQIYAKEFVCIKDDGETCLYFMLTGSAVERLVIRDRLREDFEKACIETIKATH